MINKIIFYCWFGRQEKSSQIIENLKSWKCFNPDYQIIEINENNFDYNKYSYTKCAYEQKMWAFVSDMARMEILNNSGGFCLDTDVKLISSLDTLRDYKGVWGLETSGLIAPGLVIGAEKGNEDIQNLCRIYENLTFDSNLAEKKLKSPDIVTKYFLQKGLSYNNKLQCIGDKQLILPSIYFAPYHWWGGGKVAKKTIGIHQYANSWGANLKVTNRQKIMRNWRCYFPKSYFLCRNIFNNYF